MADDIQVSSIADAIQAAKIKNASDSDIIDSLSNHPVYGPRVKEALSKGAQASDIINSLSTPLVPPPDLRGQGPVSAAMELSAGGGSGIVRTAVGVRDILQKGAKALGLKDIPDFPKEVRATAEGKEFNASGEPTNPSALFNVGRGAETAAEFVAPGVAGAGLVNKGVGAARAGIAALGGGAKLQGLAEIGAKALEGGLYTGAVTAVETGGDREALSRAALTGGVLSGAFSSVGKMLEAIPPGWAYRGLLSKIPERFSDAQVKEMFKNAVDDGITISPGGAGLAQSKITAARNVKRGLIAGVAIQPVNINTISKAVDDIMDDATAAGDAKFARQIQKTYDEFQAAYGAKPGVPATTTTVPGPNPAASLTPEGMPRQVTTAAIPPVPATIQMGQAEDAKAALNKILNAAYGKYSANRAMTQKAIERGLKESIEEIVPEAKDLNRESQNNLLMKTAIRRYLRTHESFINSQHMIMGSMLNAMGFSSGSLEYTIPASITLEALSNPRIRSALAIAADRTGSALRQIAVPAAAAATGVSTKPIPELDTSQIQVGQ